MKRSVIQLAKNTLVVTLPNKWVRRFHIKKQDQLDIEEQNNSLILTTQNDTSTEPRKVTLSGSWKHVRRQITIPYRLGCNELNVTFDNREVLSLINKALRITLGYEIISRGKNNCTIKEVANLDEHDFERLFSRYFHVILTICRDTYEILQSAKSDQLIDLDALFETEARLYLACSRLIIQSGHKITKRSEFFYLLIDQLESTADHVERVVTYLKKKNEIKVSKQTLEIFSEQIKLLEMLHRLQYKFDVQLGQEMMVKRDTIHSLHDDVLDKAKGQNVVVLHHLFNMNWSISEACSSIYGLHC